MKVHARAAWPIGVFDSGIGGLTVVRELHRALPHEDLLYLGDTARVPYGNKSPETVTRFACEDARFLVRKRVKAVVVACNTASAWALPTLQAKFKVPVFGVIQPGAHVAIEKTRTQRIGVIATTATIRSRAYQVAIAGQAEAAKVFPRACPLLVPLVEEGWVEHRVTRLVLKEYLQPLLRERIDTLILGCTHYPLLKAALRPVVGAKVALVDSAECCARFVNEQLAQAGLLNAQRQRKGYIRPFVTDDTAQFEKLADRFLGFPVEQAWKVDLDSAE